MSELAVNADTQKHTVKKDDSVLLVLTLIFGILFDILFYKTVPGISYPIFVAAYYCIVCWYMRKSLVFKYDLGWMLTVPVVFLCC